MEPFGVKRNSLEMKRGSFNGTLVNVMLRVGVCLSGNIMNVLQRLDEWWLRISLNCHFISCNWLCSMFNVLVCMRRCEVSPISFKSNCFVINAACEWKGLQIHPECNNLRAVWALVGLSSLTAFVATLCALSFACKNPSQRIAVVSCICSGMAAIFGLGAVGVWAGTDLHRVGYSFGIGKRSAPHWCFVFVVVSFWWCCSAYIRLFFEIGFILVMAGGAIQFICMVAMCVIGRKTENVTVSRGKASDGNFFWEEKGGFHDPLIISTTELLLTWNDWSLAILQTSTIRR